MHLLVRGERLRASKAMQDRVNAHNKVTVHYQTRVEDAFGDSRGLSGLHLLEGPDSAPSDQLVIPHARCKHF